MLSYTGGSFGTQPANEYCFALSSANVTFTAGFDSRYANIHTYIYATMYIHKYVTNFIQLI